MYLAAFESNSMTKHMLEIMRKLGDDADELILSSQ
jgi:hypothetical protein